MVKPIVSREETSENASWTARGDRGGFAPKACLPTGRVAGGTLKVPLVEESRISS